MLGIMDPFYSYPPGSRLKYLFYILVLVNLVFLAWKFGLDRFPPPGRESKNDVTLAMDPLDSLSPEDTEFELLPAEPDPLPLTPEAGEGEGGSLKPLCLALGPYASREEAKAGLEILKPAVQEARVIAVPGDREDGFWVLYPKARSREGAFANRQMLMNRGIYEIWLFDRGPLAGAISLGLFKSQEEADAAVQGFRAKGVATRVKPRIVLGEAFWIRIFWRDTVLALDEAIQTVNSHEENVKLPSPVACP